MRHATRHLVLVALVLLGAAVLGTTSAASAAPKVLLPISAFASEASDTIVVDEYVPLIYVDIPAQVLENPAVSLIDDLTGQTVPFTAPGLTTEDGSTRAYLPQLPPGKFTLRWDGGQRSIVVRAPGASVAAYGARDAQGGGGLNPALLILAGSVGMVVLVLLRRRGLGQAAVAAVFVLSGVVIIGGSGGTPSAADKPRWEACDLRDTLDEALLCKVSSLVAQLEDGEYASVAQLLATSTDPSCHEIAHRSSFHIWRTTRDINRATSMLIPGCDDGLIHGISESMATFTADGEFTGKLETFCNSGVQDYARIACLHGGGHATVWRTNGDLERSWEICDTFTSSDDFDIHQECKGAAVMEWSDRWTQERAGSVKTLRPRIDEPMELCLTGPDTELFRLGCYLGTNHRTGDARAAARWCTEREPRVDSCFAALGENLPYFETPLTKIPLTPEKAVHHIESCLLAQGEARNICVRSAARVLVVLKNDRVIGETVCGMLPEEVLSSCRSGIEDAIERLASRGIDL